MIPPGGTLAPLFVLLNALRLRTTLVGLAIAYASSALPFAIWNMKALSIPCPTISARPPRSTVHPPQAFRRVIPRWPRREMAVTALMGFHGLVRVHPGLDVPERPTDLYPADGAAWDGRPVRLGHSWSQFAALSIMMSLPR